MKRILLAAAILTGLGPGSKAHAGYAPGCTVALDVAGAVLHEARAVAIQPDGRIVVAGFADFGGATGREFLVARFHPDLSLDTSFNGTGYRVDDIQTRDDEAFAIAVQFDQKIVVGGYSRFNPSKVYIAIARYNRDGTRDATFGSGGFSLLDFSGSSDDEVRGLAIQPDGKILGAGFAMPSGSRQVALVRLLKNGSRDPSFDGDGGALPPISGSAFSFATGVLVQPDGKIVVSGEARFATSDFLAVRLTPNGSLDNSFNSIGWVATDIGASSTDSASSLVLQMDGKIALAGTSNGNAAVARYTPGGALDTTFGATGRALHDFGATDSGDALALDSAGNLLLAGGTSLPPSNFAIARFRPDGSVDLNKTDDISGLDDRAFGIALTRAGKLLVVGSSQGPTNPKTTLALYLPDGNQDCGPPVYPVDVFTTGSSGDSVNGKVMLNWLNPSYGPYDRTVIRRDTAGCPATDNDGVSVATQSDGLGAPGGFVDTVPLGPTYYYAAFVLDSGSQPSTGVCKSATPFDRTAGKIEWSYDTSISALTTPGLRLNVPLNESVVYTVANDGLVHAIRGGSTTSGGGSWPLGFRPFRIWNSAQARPPVVPLPPASTLAVMLGSQDGHVYAIDALSGALLWKSAKLGATLQAAPAVVLSTWGGGADLVFVGTREPGLANRFVALNAQDGTVVWAFDDGGGANGIGMIVGSASIDYTGKRVYFTSALGASGRTTWCLDYTVTPPAKCWGTYGVAPLGGGDVEASPILYQGTLFVSDTLTGDLYAVNPLDGSDAIFASLGDGGAKGFVFPQFGTPNLLASTSTSTMSVSFGFLNWLDSCVATPSTPIAIPFSDWVFVGSNQGKLFQFSASGGAGCPVPLSACVGNCASTIVGAPAFDVLNSMLYVGTDDGVIHAVQPPF
jgi:uncharacterized delta-60 repeat protein